MLGKWLQQISESLSGDDGVSEDRGDALRRATVILMIDVAFADRRIDDVEIGSIVELASRHFDIDSVEARELVEDLREDADAITSVHEFTSLLHTHLDHDEKSKIVAMLWRIAYADGLLDKYENSLILRISDLLYVSRGRVMQLKHEAAGESGQG